MDITKSISNRLKLKIISYEDVVKSETLITWLNPYSQVAWVVLTMQQLLRHLLNLLFSVLGWGCTVLQKLHY